MEMNQKSYVAFKKGHEIYEYEGMVQFPVGTIIADIGQSEDDAYYYQVTGHHATIAENCILFTNYVVKIDNPYKR